VEFPNTTTLEILNRENEHTFCSGGRLEVTDITQEALRLIESIIGWEVSSEPSLSDYRYILFILLGSILVHLIRNPRNTNWGSFKEDLRDQLDRGPAMDMKSEAGLGLVIHWLKHALILACENNCPLKPEKMGRQSLKWTTELESLRKGVRRLFNKCHSGKDTHSSDLYKEAQRNYRKEVRKASRDAWGAFCSSTDDLPKSARLHRAYSRDPTIKLGSSGRRTQSEWETLELLLTTYFPNSGVTQESAVPAAVLPVRCPDWKLVMRVANYRRVEWAIDTFAPYKSPGVDGGS
jgi:hypothetical protein